MDEKRDVTVTAPVAEAVASASPAEVKIELDRIAKILNGTNKGVRLTEIGIGVAIALSLINMALQYLKVI